MPYIKPAERKLYVTGINELLSKLRKNENHPGHINYILSKILTTILSKNRNYIECNKLIGVLECVKQELYRIQISQLENEKISENGEI